MKKYSIISILCVLLFTSCEKVIDVNLNETEPKLVVEGIVSNSDGPQTVLLSQSSNFSDKTEFRGISGATVIISDNTGVVDTLTMSDTGVYQTSKIIGTPGNTYHLTIKLNDVVYTAQSTMPDLVMIDSLRIDEIDIMGMKHILLVPWASDPGDVKNYYRFKVYRNGEPDPTLFISDDEYFNGISREFNLDPEGNENNEITKGDIFNLELINIDKEVYVYFDTLDKSLNQNSASPANPQSNITGGCLGYFSAQSSSSTTITYE